MSLLNLAVRCGKCVVPLNKILKNKEVMSLNDNRSYLYAKHIQHSINPNTVLKKDKIITIKSIDREEIITMNLGSFAFNI